jgi:hypothetical protein
LLESSQTRPACPSVRKCENEDVRKMEVMIHTRVEEFRFLIMHIIIKYNFRFLL